MWQNFLPPEVAALKWQIDWFRFTCPWFARVFEPFLTGGAVLGACNLFHFYNLNSRAVSAQINAELLSCLTQMNFLPQGQRCWGLPEKEEKEGQGEWSTHPGLPVLPWEWKDRDGLLRPAVTAVHTAWLFRQCKAKQQMYLFPDSHRRKGIPLWPQQPAALCKCLLCVLPDLSLAASFANMERVKFRTCPDFVVSVFGKSY